MADENYKRLTTLCVGNECTKDAFSRGMCKTHYSRWRIHGDCNKMDAVRHPKVCEVDGCEKPSTIRWKKMMSVCNAHWQCFYRYGTATPPPSAPPEPMPLCCVHKCKNDVRSRNNPYCEKHYTRVRRGVTLDELEPPLYRYISAAGYVILKRSDHPLAMKNGNVFEHRLVAYDMHNGNCPGCFWCGCQLTWGNSVIDHLDENKANNDKGNLVVACTNCNRARGAMLPFIKGMSDDSWLVFVDQAMKYRTHAKPQARPGE